MKNRSSSARIDEEQVCIDSLYQHLVQIEGANKVSIPIREASDPPDFWIAVAESKYAVEVTSITSPLDICLEDQCKRLRDIIRGNLDAGDLVKGKYALTLSRHPNIPKRGTLQWKNLISDAVTKVRVMSNSPVGQMHYLLKDRNGYLSLTKCSDEGDVIGIVTICGIRNEGQIQEELAQLFGEAIQAKRKRMHNKNVLALCSNIILVFYDAYGFGDIEDIKKAFTKVQGYEWLHSIFISPSFSNRPNSLYPTSPGRSGLFLYSRNQEWL